MNSCKCFFCGKEAYIVSNKNQEIYDKYGYRKSLAGKIGKKIICNQCKNDIYKLINENITDN